MSPYPRGRPLGWMLHRAPNGDLVTLQPTRIAYPTSLTVQEIWTGVNERTAPASWNGLEPQGGLVIWWAEPEVELRMRELP